MDFTLKFQSKKELGELLPRLCDPCNKIAWRKKRVSPYHNNKCYGTITRFIWRRMDEDVATRGTMNLRRPNSLINDSLAQVCLTDWILSIRQVR